MTDCMTAAFDLGRAQWPTIRTLTSDAFQAFVVDGAIEPDAVVERGADIYLAAAAASGDEQAVKLFDSKLLADLPRWLSRLRLQPDVFDEVRQLLRAKLLVGPPPKLAQYRANGPRRLGPRGGRAHRPGSAQHGSGRRQRRPGR